MHATVGNHTQQKYFTNLRFHINIAYLDCSIPLIADQTGNSQALCFHRKHFRDLQVQDVQNNPKMVYIAHTCHLSIGILKPKICKVKFRLEGT